MTSSFWLSEHSFTSSDVVTDILIVGGGYVGLSTAFWLLEIRPDLNITILDRATCGSGASGKNAGFLTVGSAAFYKKLFDRWGREDAKAIWSFATQSVELLHQNILSKASSEIIFEKSSSITLFRNEDSLDLWNKSNFIPEEFNYSWKKSKDLPKPLKSNFWGGYEISPEYKINPAQLILSLRKLLEKRGVRIIEDTHVFELIPAGVKTSRNLIKANKVILALNGYLSQFHPAFKNLVVPTRAQMLAVEIDCHFDCPHMYYDPAEKVYWRKTDEKVLIIGGKRMLDESGEIGEFEKISPLIQSGLEEYLNRLRLNFKVINRWSGVMGFTQHELPIIDQITSPIETYVVLSLIHI